MGKKVMFVMSIFVAITLISLCNLISKAANKSEYKIVDVRIYKDTPAWELALAVKHQNTGTIEKIAKNKPELLNYQDPKYGATLLLWAVGTERYQSAEALLKCGADPRYCLE
jgi:hypothetical protein